MAHLYGFVTRNQAAEDGTICDAPDWLKQGAIKVEEALPMMSINAAYAIFREHEIGSLETGKLADMVILSESPLRVQPEAIKDISVLVTMIGGKVEYCAAGPQALCPAVPPIQSKTFPFGFIDVPVAEATLSGTIDIAGWALDDHGIERVEIYMDGNHVADALYGDPRPDVDHDYPGREGAPNFGFTYKLDTSAYSNGSHTVQAIAVNKAGNKKPLTPENLAVTIIN